MNKYVIGCIALQTLLVGGDLGIDVKRQQAEHDKKQIVSRTLTVHSRVAHKVMRNTLIREGIPPVLSSIIESYVLGSLTFDKPTPRTHSHKPADPLTWVFPSTPYQILYYIDSRGTVNELCFVNHYLNSALEKVPEEAPLKMHPDLWKQMRSELSYPYTHVRINDPLTMTTQYRAYGDLLLFFAHHSAPIKIEEYTEADASNLLKQQEMFPLRDRSDFWFAPDLPLQTILASLEHLKKEMSNRACNSCILSHEKTGSPCTYSKPQGDPLLDKRIRDQWGICRFARDYHYATERSPYYPLKKEPYLVTLLRSACQPESEPVRD